MNILQKSANSIKRVLKWKHLPIGIEFEPGDKKHGHATMKNASYGHIRGTWGKGEDGMSIDVYIGPDLGSDRIFKLSQVFPDTGEFDESKYIIGCWDKDEAKALYLAHMPKRFFGSLKEVDFSELKPYQKLQKYAIAGALYTLQGGKLIKATVRTPAGTGVLIQEKPKYPTTGKDHRDIEGAIAATVRDAHERHNVHLPGLESIHEHGLSPVMHLEMNRHVIEHLDGAKELGVNAFNAPAIRHSVDRTEKPLRVKYNDPKESPGASLGSSGLYDSENHTIHLFAPKNLQSIKELKEHDRAKIAPSEYAQYAKNPTVKPLFTDPGETFAHELSHALHHNNLVGQNNQELFHQGIGKKYRDVARSHLSRYGATNKAEFVAETGTQILTGQDVHPEAMHLYRQFGGPMVKFAGVDYEFRDGRLIKVPCGKSHIPKTKHCSPEKAAQTPPERLEAYAGKARQEKGLRPKSEVNREKEMGDRTLPKALHQLSLEELMQMHQQAIDRATESGKTDIHPDNLKMRRHSEGMGSKIRSVADSLASEQKVQVKATSGIIGAAAQMANNYDRLVDEVVDVTLDDLNREEQESSVSDKPTARPNLAPGTTILHEFSNHDDGVTAVVAQIAKGFSVVLRDDDSGSVVPHGKIFPFGEGAKEKAIAWAREISKQTPVADMATAQLNRGNLDEFFNQAGMGAEHSIQSAKKAKRKAKDKQAQVKAIADRALSRFNPVETNSEEPDTDRIIHALTELSGEPQLKALGLDKKHFRDPKKAKELRNEIARRIHPDVSSHPKAQDAMNKLTKLFNQVLH